MCHVCICFAFFFAVMDGGELTILSTPPDAKKDPPFGENAAAVTPPSWPRNVYKSCPSRRSQILQVASSEAEIM